MKNKHGQNEGQAQGMAMAMCDKGVDRMIQEHAQLYRDIVESFKRNKHRIPEPEEINWVASEHLHHDITKEQ